MPFRDLATAIIKNLGCFPFVLVKFYYTKTTHKIPSLRSYYTNSSCNILFSA